MGPISSDNVHTLSVGIEAGTYTPAEGETKASMEAVIRVNWTANDDEVSVVNATKGKILGGCLKAKESGTSVTFEGTVTGTIDNGDRLYYIYPKLNNTGETDFADAGYDVSLAGQTYDGDNPDKVSFFGYAEDVAGSATISKKIQFKLVTSYAHLNMANLPAKGFNLSSIDISKINKGFKWSLSDSGELTADAYGENEGISVNCSNCKITQAGNAVVRFAIPASAATGSEPRVVTVNKAYTNDKYVKDQLIPSAYYNQLYTSWTNENVNVNSMAGDKTEVSINNLGSTETAEGILPVSGESSSAFDNSKPTEIKLGGLGTITFNQQASAAIKNNTQNAQSTNVFFKVEDVTETKPVQNANLVYEITMKTVDGNGTEVFSEDNAGTGSKATVVIELGQSVERVQSVSLVDDNGNLVSGDVTIDSFSEGKLTFTVVHFSKYAIKYTTKAEPESGYVAQIGGRKYETLASAIAAAQNGNTIQMIADHEIVGNAGVTIEKNQNIILDLAGRTVKNLVNESKASQIITNKGTLKIIGNGTLTNTLAEGTIAGDWPTYNYVTNLITNLGTLTIENGTFANTQDSGITYALDNNSNGVDAVATINGGKFTSVGNSAVRMFCNSTTAANTLTINGGYFEGKYYAVSVSNASGATKVGTLNVNGGEFESTADEYNACIANWESNKSSNISVNITGGKFNDYVLIASNASVTGGLFKYKEYTDPDDGTEYNLANYVAPGYELVDNQDAGYPYKVQQKPFVAKIGETGYFSFADAVEAVQENQTIEVLSDIALDSPITILKSGVTIDGKGKSIAVSENTYWDQYKVSGDKSKFGKCDMITVKADNFTLKNVTLDGKDCRGVSLCTTKSGGNILYQNITYKGRGSGHYYGIATGLVTFDGCTFDIQGYAIHFDGSASTTDDVVIKDCIVNGWSSFGACKSLTISDSHFGGANDEGKNGWLAVLRPYCPTTITDCTFSNIYLHTAVTNYECIGLGTGAATTVILNGCKVVNDAKQATTDEIYSIVRDNAFDNAAAQSGSVFAFDAEGNAADGFKSGIFYASSSDNIKVAQGFKIEAVEGKANIWTITPVEYKTTLLCGDQIFGQYETIADAVWAFNYDSNITAGNYTLNIKPGTYNEDMILFIQDKTEGKIRTLQVQSADPNQKVVVKSTSANKAVFGISAESDYSGGPISFKNIDFDVTENTNSETCVIYFAGSQSGKPEEIFPEPQGPTSNRRYAHEVSFDNCNFVGNGKTTNVFRAPNGSSASGITINNCNAEKIGYFVQGYFVDNTSHNWNALHIEGCVVNSQKCFINRNNNGHTEYIKDCDVTGSNDYIFRTDGGKTTIINSKFKNIATSVKDDHTGILVFRGTTSLSIDDKSTFDKGSVCEYDIYCEKGGAVTLNGTTEIPIGDGHNFTN